MPPATYCTCDTYTGSERNAAGEKVCERCGKPDQPPPAPMPGQRDIFGNEVPLP